MLESMLANCGKQYLKIQNTDPIDIHTPLWLWSRNGFTVQIGDANDEFIQNRL